MKWFIDLYIWVVNKMYCYKKQYEEQRKINDTMLLLIKDLHETHKQIDKYVRLNEKNKNK
jgi:hypothetical protein|tara:strand:- start:86 stop:265 length:180 start_codon:yes stop_codon:yes gene_type:complete